MEIKELAEQLNTASAEVKKAQEEIAKEVKLNGAASDETKAALEKFQSDHAETVDAIKSQMLAMDSKLKDVELKGARMFGAPEERKTLGQLFVDSDVYSAMKSTGRGSGAPFNVERKDITSLAASAGSLIRPSREVQVYQNPNRPVRMRDLLRSVPAGSNAVEFMRELSFTNNAAPQGSSAGLGGGEFVAKAQSEVTYELVTTPIRTVAHWFAASRQVLNDAPMLRGLVDGRAVYGLDLESDAQLLLGDGTGQNLTGILVDAAINDAGELPSGTAVGDVPAAMIDHIRKAIRIEQEADYYNMTGLVMNPADWEVLETAKATDGHYLMVSMPTDRATETVWRIPVVITNAMPADTFLIGDFSMGATLYEQESISIRISESHSDYFVKNGVAVLAEERYALAIPLPNAFCKGLFTVAA